MIREVLQKVKLRVDVGKVPKALKGTYFKNGPTGLGIKGNKESPFDGNGYVSKLVFDGKGNSPEFQGRHVDTWQRKIENTMLGSRIFPRAFGGPLVLGGRGLLYNASNTNVMVHNGELVSFYDGGVPIKMDAYTLDTHGTWANFREGDFVNSHAKRVDGGLVVMEYRYSMTTTPTHTTLVFHLLRADGGCVKTEIKLNDFVYAHDFVVTPSYYIVFDNGIELDWLQMDVFKGIASNLRQNKKGEGNIYIIDRLTGRVQKETYNVDGFITHHATSLEVHPGLVIVYNIEHDTINHWTGKGALKKYWLNSNKSQNAWECYKTKIENAFQMEFPSLLGDDTIDFAYSVGDGLGKFEEGRWVHSRLGDGWVIGEPILADKDYLIANAVKDEEKSNILIFNVRTLDIECILDTGTVGGDIGLGLHGCWTPIMF